MHQKRATVENWRTIAVQSQSRCRRRYSRFSFSGRAFGPACTDAIRQDREPYTFLRPCNVHTLLPCPFQSSMRVCVPLFPSLPVSESPNALHIATRRCNPDPAGDKAHDVAAPSLRSSEAVKRVGSGSTKRLVPQAERKRKDKKQYRRLAERIDSGRSLCDTRDMTIKSFVAWTGESVADFAKRCGVSRGTAHRWIRAGAYPRGANIAKVVRGTGGKVSTEEACGMGST